jgi:hypothetical protein
MKKLLIAVLCLIPAMAMAQEHYKAGSYWAVTAVDTHDGQFEAYVEDLDGLWRKQMDMLMKDGKVLSYKMFSNVNARHGEPDLWLMVEWKSAADMLDTPYEYWEEKTKALSGSMEASRKKSMKRGEIRTIMSDTMLREITFK